MGGYAHGPGVGNSLAIDQDQIRSSCQPEECFQQDWGFPEGEEARDVGKRGVAFGRCPFQEGQIGVGEEKKTSMGHIV
jgi:hypothetical protein